MEESLLVEAIVKKILDSVKNVKLIPIEASAKHVHLSQEHIDKLFGKGYKMTKKRELSQPGQFLCEERVRIIGPKNVIEGVAILGPPRKRTQVEISMTDARILGMNPPLRESGNLEGSSNIYIAGEKGIVDARESVIIAKRHIHMSFEDAQKFNVENNQSVKVRVKSMRPVVFEDVIVRVSDKYKLSMHIDYDEANAAGFENGVMGELITYPFELNLSNTHEIEPSKVLTNEEKRITKKVIVEKDVEGLFKKG
ncbi:MAG: propanediol utilization protein [Bacteroidetes bacterium 4572_77]|nr:MAG: propanediol utilization protein [Bacteroidetes bacterium 4572_77]